MTFMFTAILIASLAPLVVLGLWPLVGRRESSLIAVANDPAQPRRLSQLKDDQVVRVERLDDQCAGLSRRRMLDFGLTPGARVQRELAGAFGGTCVYRVRGTLLALRREQADQVWVRTTSDS